MIVKIGENEYDEPITLFDDAYEGGLIDANGMPVNISDLHLAIKELASLRQERDDLQKRVEELEEANKVLADGLSEIGIAVADITQKESPDEN